MSQGPPSSGSASPGNTPGGGGYRPQFVEQVLNIFMISLCFKITRLKLKFKHIFSWMGIMYM